MVAQKQRGFTLVELLTVIAIIGILVGLALPALNMARETARKAQCANNLKNLALGAINHETAKGYYPGYMQSFGRYTGAADPANPANKPAAHEKVGTWAVALLPYIGAEPSFEHWSENRYPILSTQVVSGSTVYDPLKTPNIEAFICPSDFMNETETFGINSYVANVGYWAAYPFGGATAPSQAQAPSTQNPANGLFLNRFAGVGFPMSSVMAPSRGVTMASVKDAPNQTVMFSENLQAAEWWRLNYEDDGGLPVALDFTSVGTPPLTQDEAWLLPRCLTGMVWHYFYEGAYQPSPGNPAVLTPPASDPQKINGDMATRRISTMKNLAVVSSVTNVNNAALYAGPSSGHADGVNMVFMDGSIRFVAQTISYEIYQALMTPRGKSSDVPFNEFVLSDDQF